MGVPYLDGFPPADELPGVSWIAKLIASVARTLLGAARYVYCVTLLLIGTCFSASLQCQHYMYCFVTRAMIEARVFNGTFSPNYC